MADEKRDPRAALAAAADDTEMVDTLRSLMKAKKKVWVTCQHCGKKTPYDVIDSAVRMNSLKMWIEQGFGKARETPQEGSGAGAEIRALLEYSPQVRARALSELRQELERLRTGGMTNGGEEIEGPPGLQGRAESDRGEAGSVEGASGSDAGGVDEAREPGGEEEEPTPEESLRAPKNAVR